MKIFLTSLFASLILLGGCGQQATNVPDEINGFIETLKENGVDGKLLVKPPFNEDMVYVAEYEISRYASTRVISLFKFKDAEKAEANLQEALKNDKLSGQARNMSFVMAATFYPPDDEALEKIKVLFLTHKFEQ